MNQRQCDELNNLFSLRRVAKAEEETALAAYVEATAKYTKARDLTASIADKMQRLIDQVFRENE